MKSENISEENFLEGKLLIAMPGIGDARFERSVIYVCVHNPEGAMGLVLNKPISNVRFPDLLEQLSINVSPEPAIVRECERLPVLIGGPVESGRGFVLHSQDYFSEDSTLPLSRDMGLTATMDILRAIAEGQGPSQALLALGYSGWTAGQLEAEIQSNGWLHCEADANIIFDHNIDAKYSRALAMLGINLSILSGDAGHA